MSNGLFVPVFVSRFVGAVGAGVFEIRLDPVVSAKSISPDHQSPMASLSSSAYLQPSRESDFISR